MKFQKISFIFLVTLFVIEVWTDDNHIIPMTFIGLKGDEGMGHSGYIHVSTDVTVPEFELSGCKSMDANETMCRFTETSLNNGDVLVILRAWMAVTLRDNILSILGYLLHQSKVQFDDIIESSLQLIYNEVRKNNIQILEFLSKFKAIVNLNEARRSVALFRALQFAMPIYCRSALEELIRIFFKLTNNAINNSMLDTPSSELGAYLMANIDVRVLQLSHFKTSRSVNDRAIENKFGAEYANFFSAIHDGKIILTQPVLAILMSLTRFKELPAHEHEDFKFLIDVLLYNKIPDWHPSKSVNLINIDGPYILITTLMKALANHHTVDPVIKKIAINFQSHLISGHKVDSIKPMLRYFQKPDLNVSMILELLEEAAPIPEAKELRHMINVGTINLNYALKAFNRYYYDTPNKLLLAFVRRIQNRVPMNIDSRDNIQRIILHLSKVDNEYEGQNHHNLNARSRRNANDTTNVNASYYSSTVNDDDDDDDDADGDYEHTSFSQSCHNVDGCFTTVRQKTSNTAQTVASQRSESNCPIELPDTSLSSWLTSLDGPVINAEPFSLVANVSTVLATFMKDSSLKNRMDEIVGNSGRKHNTNNATLNVKSLQHNSHVPHNSSVTHTVKENEKYDGNSRRTTSIDTKKNLLIRLLRGMLNMEKVCARNVVYYEVMRVYCLLIHGLGDYKSTTVTTVLQLDNQLSADISEKLSQIVSPAFKELIISYNSIKNLSSNDSETKQFTNRRFLVDLCKNLLNTSSVQNNNDLFNEIVLFLHSIQDLPMQFTQLMQHITSLPVENYSQFRVVYDYLANPEFLRALGDDFDIGRYSTKGRLFKAIMEKISNHDAVKQNTNLLLSIQTLVPKIVCSGHGAESSMNLLLSVKLEQMNIDQILANAADKAKIDSNFDQKVSNMWQLYGGPSNSATPQANTNSSMSHSRFVEGLLHTMEFNVEREYVEIKKDIASMRSAISNTANASAPVDYV